MASLVKPCVRAVCSELLQSASNGPQLAVASAAHLHDVLPATNFSLPQKLVGAPTLGCLLSHALCGEAERACTTYCPSK